ncbi:MAG: outer rane efflux protein [Labilithrix sp.]|nr:outer rane efflux protein [Labilithrix sp.]
MTWCRVNIASIAVAALIAGVAWPSPARAQEQLRMEDAIRLALANNERAQKAVVRVETAEGQVDRARTAFFPSLTANGSGTWRATEDRTGRSTTTNGTVTLTQPILVPSAFPLYAQAKHTRESERWAANQDRRVLAFDTARAFLQVLTSERVLEAAARRLDRAKANLQNAEARAQAGLASTNDATRALVEQASSLREVAQAQGSAAKAHTQLSFLVGKRIEGALAEPDRTTQGAESFENAAQSKVQEAIDRRPDVRAAAERTLALKLSAKEPLYRLIPSLSAQGQLRVLPDPLPTEKATDETVSLTLTWNVFDQGARYADRRTRLAQSESQQLDEKLLRRSVATDVELAIIALRTAREAYRIAGDAVAATQRLIDEEEILYRQGLARAIEVTTANAQRFDAEVSRASAKLSMEQAYLELRFALGLAPIDEELPK